MADDGKIYIVITNRTPEQVESGTAGVQSTNDKKETQDLLGDFAKHKFFNFIESQAKQYVSYSISNIGNFTGDFQAQREMTTLTEIAGRAVTLVTAGIAGAKFGIVGVVVAEATAITNMVVTDVRAERLKKLADAKENYTIEQLRQKTGMYSLMDGSRGTEN